MILFPAIDLKEGSAVRLEQGDMARATVFHREPAAQARAFEQQGFEYLHIVDLDGAFAGKPMNGAAVDRILETVNIPVQLGGGIRDTATVEAWLEKGVTRVIIGTAAVRDPPFVRQAARDYPGQIAVGLDARGGKVAVEGWAETSELSVLDIMCFGSPAKPPYKRWKKNLNEITNWNAFDRSHYMTDSQIDAWVAETRHKVMYRDAQNVD